MEILNDLMANIHGIYLITVVCAIYLVLKYIVLKPTKRTKILLSILMGIILGVITIYLDKDSKPMQVIMTFFVAMVGYNWIIKGIMQKLGDKYDNNKGLV